MLGNNKYDSNNRGRSSLEAPTRNKISLAGGIKNSMSIASLASSVQAQAEVADINEQPLDEAIQESNELSKSGSAELYQVRFKRKTKIRSSEPDLSVERALNKQKQLYNKSQMLSQEVL